MRLNYYLSILYMIFLSFFAVLVRLPIPIFDSTSISSSPLCHSIKASSGGEFPKPQRVGLWTPWVANPKARSRVCEPPELTVFWIPPPTYPPVDQTPNQDFQNQVRINGFLLDDPGFHNHVTDFLGRSNQSRLPQSRKELTDFLRTIQPIQLPQQHKELTDSLDNPTICNQPVDLHVLPQQFDDLRHK